MENTLETLVAQRTSPWISTLETQLPSAGRSSCPWDKAWRGARWGHWCLMSRAGTAPVGVLQPSAGQSWGVCGVCLCPAGAAAGSLVPDTRASPSPCPAGRGQVPGSLCSRAPSPAAAAAERWPRADLRALYCSLRLLLSTKKKKKSWSPAPFPTGRGRGRRYGTDLQTQSLPNAAVGNLAPWRNHHRSRWRVQFSFLPPPPPPFGFQDITVSNICFTGHITLNLYCPQIHLPISDK